GTFPTGGTFRLSLGGTIVTGDIAYPNPFNAALLEGRIQAALDAALGAGNTDVQANDENSLTNRLYTVTFKNDLAGVNMPQLAVNVNQLTPPAPLPGIAI